MRIDLLDPASFSRGQPHDQFRWLRQNAPVYRHAEPDGAGFWALTRHAEVCAVGRDSATYSSVPTIMIPDPDDVAAAMSMGDHQMMLTMDPPRHTRYRRLISREFTPRASEAWRPRIRALAQQIVGAVADRGECDLVADLAGEMPSFVIAELLGLPLEDGRELYKLTETIHASPDSVEPGAQAGAVLHMFNYAAGVVRERRKTPTDDLASKILHAEIDGERLDDIDFNLFFLLLIDAGGDTTRNLVGGGMQALFEHPEQRAWLEQDLDGRLPGAVEEMLRYVSPVIYMRRTATRDAELSGQKIREGDKVVMYYGAANRDPVVFDEPERFDLARQPNPHVAFGGGGAHFCLGAHIARIEIEELLRELLTRLPDLEPTGETEWLSSTFISGPKRLPVRFAAR
jgi:cytochrome P450